MTGSARVSRTPHKGMPRPSLTAQMWGQAGGHPTAGQSYVLSVPVPICLSHTCPHHGHTAATTRPPFAPVARPRAWGSSSWARRRPWVPLLQMGRQRGKRKCQLGMSGDGLWGKHGCRCLCLNPSSHRTGVHSGLNPFELSQDVCAASASCLCPSTG